MFLLYDFLFFIYALLYLPYLLITRRVYPGFEMRFGLFSLGVKEQIRAKANIWIHAVSVGEVMVLEGFIEALKKTYPAYQIVASVTTKTGYELACQRLKDKAIVIPSPIDFSFVAKSFVSLVQPKVYIAVETEIWPNLYKKLSQQNIPIMVINGRISDASFGRYKAIRFILKSIVTQVRFWCMQSQTDAQRIMELGADSSCVLVTGNVKFDDLKTFDLSVADLLNNKDEFWFVAGSTHPGEEEIILDVYSKIIKDDPKWRLIIAPRHVERSRQIMALIESRGMKAMPFSTGQISKGVVVVDTIGHLRSLYAKASLVFVGKSLCVGGGHNIIEPAFYGKAIIIGPKVQNFRDIVACFKEAQAIVQVEDAKSFEQTVRSLCLDPSRRDSLGAAAKAVINTNQGATRRSLDCLVEVLK